MNNLIECAETCEEKHEDADDADWWMREIDGYVKPDNRRKKRGLTSAGREKDLISVKEVKLFYKSKKEKFSCYECLKYLPAAIRDANVDEENDVFRFVFRFVLIFVR